MGSRKIRQIAKRYLLGQTSAEETARVLSWFKTTEGQRFLADNLDADLASIDHQPVLIGDELNKENILLNIFSEEARNRKVDASDTNDLSIKRSAYPQMGYRIAASVIILMMALGAWYLHLERDVIYTSSFGEKKTIILPDSSAVMLNGNSSLRLSKRWAPGDDREVTLSGEAFFQVVHTRNHSRFTVLTNDRISIEVLGTQFNVNNRDRRTEVFLEEGSIRLKLQEGGKTSALVMAPGEFVALDESTSYVIRKQTVANDAIASWTKEKLVIDNERLSDIAAMLESTYGLKLIIDDPQLLQRRISGTVPNKDVDLLLKGLAEILDVEISRQLNLVYVKHIKKP